MLNITLQFFGGRGSGGGKGSGGGAGSRTITGSSGTYTQGETVQFKETNTRYTLSGTGERIPKQAGKTVDTVPTDRTNSDGSTTRTYIVRGNKGNLYSVESTYKAGKGYIGGAGFSSFPATFKTKTVIRKVTKKK